MTAAYQEVVPASALVRPERGSQEVVRAQSSHELIFGVVGHIGSGASTIAQQLRIVLEQQQFTVHDIKARSAIINWTIRHGPTLPTEPTQPTVAYVTALQDAGDRLRLQTNDHAAIARALVAKIRSTRAEANAVQLSPGEPVTPNDIRRAYILDSIRHPAEVELLRHVYRSAFVLVGVVCEEDERRKRITEKFSDAGREAASQLMERDAQAPAKWGQRVSDAFHLADVFLDNTPTRLLAGMANPEWDVVDQLARVVRLLTRSQVIRPTPHEVAMYAAHGARMRSACLSRQVGAALVDRKGNLVATGTNEVPRAGGGVYGIQAQGDEDRDPPDHRCAFTSLHGEKYCSNTREQTEIINELLGSIGEYLKDSKQETLDSVGRALRTSRIGGLLEFSRAVHAEMDAILAAGRSGAAVAGARLYVTTFPCHYCARHAVASGLDEIHYIEPYPKSKAIKLHSDSITSSATGWKSPSAGGSKVLIRPFTGVAPRLYDRVFMKESDLKDSSGRLAIGDLPWGDPARVHRVSYAQLEAELARDLEAT